MWRFVKYTLNQHLDIGIHIKFLLPLNKCQDKKLGYTVHMLHTHTQSKYVSCMDPKHRKDSPHTIILKYLNPPYCTCLCIWGVWFLSKLFHRTMGQTHAPTWTGTMRSSQEINNKKLNKEIKNSATSIPKAVPVFTSARWWIVHMFNVLFSWTAPVHLRKFTGM